ncbi:MAG: hypothetical protein HY902_14230 [Deltaproteobacteria bacterium]|nr:hypothetical protein [Deltaproteobacteria bacterium]
MQFWFSLCAGFARVALGGDDRLGPGSQGRAGSKSVRKSKAYVPGLSSGAQFGRLAQAAQPREFAGTARVFQAQ